MFIYFFNKLLRIFLTLFILQFTIAPGYAGGHWTPMKHKGIFISSVSPIIYSTLSDQSGGISLHRRVSDITLQLYSEYGITNNPAVVLNWPFKYVQTGSSIRSGGDSVTLPSGRMICLGNASMELKYKFYQKNKVILTGGIKSEAPTSKYRNETGLRTGYDCWSIIPTAHVGFGYSERLYS